MKILGIDPSVENVGIAWYDTDSRKLKTQTFHPYRKKETTTTNIGVQITKQIILNGWRNVDYFVIEHPQWEDSQRGRMAMQKGYTLDLAFLCGYLSSSVGLPASSIWTPTPMEWKGNLPKIAVGHRFEKRFLVSANSITDHEFEAAMMIDWLMVNVLAFR